MPSITIQFVNTLNENKNYNVSTVSIKYFKSDTSVAHMSLLLSQPGLHKFRSLYRVSEGLELSVVLNMETRRKAKTVCHL